MGLGAKMTDQERAVMQQALEAMEYHVEQTRPIHRTSEAITALRAALAEPVLKPTTLKRGLSGQCTRKVCECEKEGFGLECIHLEPTIDGYPLWSGMPKGAQVQDIEDAIEAALADQPQTTHWQGCEEVHPECAAKSWDELEQQYQSGCAHCTHPQYVGIRCNVCGRWTEKT